MLTKEQQEERRKGLGGSDAAAILGMNPYKTPLDVYLEKVEGFYNTDSNDAIHFGNVLEPVIAKEYIERTGKGVYKSDGLRQSLTSPFMIGNIDYYIFELNGILECKTTSSYKKDEWGNEGSDFIPSEYLIQCAHYAIVTEVDYVDIAVLIGGQDFRIFTYHRNEELEEKIIEAEKDFWNNHVLTKIPPYPRSMNDINKLYPSSKDSSILADETIKSIICSYNSYKKEIKELENECENMKVMILDHIKDNDFLVDENGKKIASYKAQTRNTFNTLKFKEENPELYLDYIKESKVRAFKTYGEKNEQQ